VTKLHTSELERQFKKEVCVNITKNFPFGYEFISRIIVRKMRKKQKYSPKHIKE